MHLPDLPVLAALDVWWPCVVSVHPGPCVYCHIGGTQSGFSYNERATPDCVEQNIGAKYTIIKYSCVECLNMLHL